MTPFHHVVLFRLHDDADADAALAALDAAKPVAGLVSWQVHRSLDERKGRVIAQVSVFESVDAFRTWRDSERHHAAVAHMRDVADWHIADWEAS
jgi:heme-degrading monooxygenase HmoA